MLTGERRSGQVFGSCRRTHRYAGLRRTVAQRAVRDFDFAHECVGKFCRSHRAADRGAGARQRFHIVDVQVGERIADALLQSVCGKKLAVGKRSGRKSAGHADAFRGELPDHFPQGRVLAPDSVDVPQPQTFEPDHPFLFCHTRSASCIPAQPLRRREARILACELRRNAVGRENRAMVAMLARSASIA